ncbi:MULTISPECIES: hypothetical protein [Paenibacillus]|uniref:hypothetical protein n=1 Tax=Paenibacillus illinoisensis TaxID=59845 RepID=UPI001C8F0756|nr:MULTISPECIES: hypothetical protein [Paenibacillus]WJH29972.1 hypothetical protein N6H13_04340 [Paenibacillus sp. CC-CFT742]
MAPEAAPLGANNGRMPDYPHEDASSFTPKSITSDNHLTGAVHTGHVIPAFTCSGSLLSMILVTLPITDIHRFNSLPSLYISLMTLATCGKYSPMKAAPLLSSYSVGIPYAVHAFTCSSSQKSPPDCNVSAHLV